MEVDEVSCRAIEIGQEFRNLGRWSWMLMQGKNNVRTMIVTTYCPIVNSIIGGAYIKQLEYLTVVKIQNYIRT